MFQSRHIYWHEEQGQQVEAHFVELRDRVEFMVPSGFNIKVNEAK